MRCRSALLPILFLVGQLLSQLARVLEHEQLAFLVEDSAVAIDLGQRQRGNQQLIEGPHELQWRPSTTRQTVIGVDMSSPIGPQIQVQKIAAIMIATGEIPVEVP